MAKNKNEEPKPNYLLIDDDGNFSKIIKRAGENMGVNITCIESLVDLQRMRNLGKFDAILLDYDLEDATGFEVAEVLEKKAKDKPVVMISSTNRPLQDVLANLPNIVGFVSKWARPNEFISRSASALREKPGISVAA